MNKYRGGKTPLLSSYRVLVALLVCACAAVGAMAWDASQTTAVQGQSGDLQTNDTIECRGVAPPLLAAPLTLEKPGLHASANSDLYYDVQGNSPAEINAQMAACSPAAPHEGTGEFAADTSYLINWRFNHRPAGQGLCAVDKVAVGLVTRHIYPRWQVAGAPGTLRAKWDMFMGNLAVHEAGHAALDRQYAEQILHNITSLPATDCSKLDQQVSKTARAAVSALDAAHIDYDTTTGHGRTQGAVLR